MKTAAHLFRLFMIQAWFSYRALFAWSSPIGYFSIKFGFPLFAMLLFVFMAKFAGISDPIYIVMGNIFLMPISNGILGVSQAVYNEKAFGAMSYLLGSPAERIPLFMGRAFYQVLDGFITVLVALPIGMLVFRMDITCMNIGLLLFCILLLSITTCGLGFLMGSITLVNRDADMVTNTLVLAYYVLVGVNFPVSMLPGFLQVFAWCLPMTRGLQAARLALAGSGWDTVAALVWGELGIGLAYTVVGYALFRILERRSLSTGMLDNV